MAKMQKVVGKYSNKFHCLVDLPCYGCKWFENAKPFTLGELTIIGWCARFKFDPDAGHVALHKNPPCLVWSYERDWLMGLEKV